MEVTSIFPTFKCQYICDYLVLCMKNTGKNICKYQKSIGIYVLLTTLCKFILQTSFLYTHFETFSYFPQDLQIVKTRIKRKLLDYSTSNINRKWNINTIDCCNCAYYTCIYTYMCVYVYIYTHIYGLPCWLIW